MHPKGGSNLKIIIIVVNMDRDDFVDTLRLIDFISSAAVKVSI